MYIQPTHDKLALFGGGGASRPSTYLMVALVSKLFALPDTII